MENSSDSGSYTSAGTPILESSHGLHFPRPTVNTRVTTWIQSISSKEMASDSESFSHHERLEGSAYEVIDTDRESRDDHQTVSIASTDFCQSEDITSLENTECSGVESSEENLKESSHSAFFEEAVHQAFNCPTMCYSSQHVAHKTDQPLSPLLECEESFDEDEGTIGVRRVVAELDEDQSSIALEHQLLGIPSQRVFLCVRQTVARFGLGLKEPLRILYVGSHLARQDIIHKIASSVIASEENIAEDEERRYSSSQHYNVIPISAFGSEITPEIELMHSSRYQIKVDNCHSAYIQRSEKNPKGPDTIKLVLDDHFTCYSVPSRGDTFTIQPSWDLPHVAIIHFSEADDLTLTRSRSVVKGFLDRHRIPSIVISQKLLLSCNHHPSVDPNSLHMSLESRDLDGKGTTIHQRLPIDLNTFLKIDPRQINRSLAYLIGIHEPLNNSSTLKDSSSRIEPLKMGEYLLKSIVSLFWVRCKSMIEFASLPRICLLGLILAILAIISHNKNISPPIISVNNKLILNSPRLKLSASPKIVSPTMLFSCKLQNSPIKSTLITCNVTGTSKKLSGPSKGNLIDLRSFSKTPFASKSLYCTSEVFGDEEVLIRVSASVKSIHSKNEAISVKIMRDNYTIETDQAYGYDDSLLLLIPKKQAYGLVKVSIDTMKKPRLHKTCTLDFRSSFSRILHDLSHKISQQHSRTSEKDSKYLSHISKASTAVDNFIYQLRTNYLRFGDTCHTETPLSFLGDNVISNFRNLSFNLFTGVSKLDDPKFYQKYSKTLHKATVVAKDLMNKVKGNSFNIYGSQSRNQNHLSLTGTLFTNKIKALSLKIVQKFTLLSNKIGIQVGGKNSILNDSILSLREKIFIAQVRSNILWLKLNKLEKEATKYQEKARIMMKKYSQEKQRRN